MNNARKKWLYLPVEVKLRELDAKLLFAYYAVKQGYRVVIGEHKMVEMAAAHYPAGIFYSKGYPKGFRKRIISTASQNGHQIVELDEEGLIIHDKNDYLTTRMQVNILQQVAQQYCWGAKQREIISPNLVHANVDSFITGSPRFDLLTPKFRPLYEVEVNRLQKKYGSFILINTRFSRYNSIIGKKVNNEHDQYIKSLYDHFVQLIHMIAINFPEKQIIIRPHPGEQALTYVKEFSKVPNVQIIREGNIVKWLLAASVMIHHGCTTSFESFLLNKPIISYVPVTSKKFDIELPNKLGIRATNIHEVIQLLHNPANLTHSVKDKNELLQQVNEYCRWSPTYYAYESILSLLNNMKKPRAKDYPRIRKALYQKEHKHVQHFFPHLHLKEIEAFFKKLTVIEKQQNEFMIKSLGKNVFIIESK